MKRLLYLLITITLLFSLSSCSEMEVRTYPSESYGTYNPTDRHDITTNPADRHDITTRIGNQQKRINMGIEKGDLTRHEADMLQENLDHIKDEYSRMKADGRLTQQEVDRLVRDLEINDRMIQDKRSNQIKRLYGPAPAPKHDHGKAAEFQTRIDQQQKRIDNGIRSGELTRKEAEIVQENLDKIKAAYSRMKADGRLSEKEQEKLDSKLDRNDKMIYDKKHNTIERFD